MIYLNFDLSAQRNPATSNDPEMLPSGIQPAGAKPRNIQGWRL
jgi:hypothetical protein